MKKSLSLLGGAPTILDCSLRDGGYVNSWDFPLPLIRQHVGLLDEIGVPLVEVGLRTPSATSSRYRGLTGYTPFALLAELKQSTVSAGLGVMVNVADFATAGELETNLAPESREKSLDFVRLATHRHDIARALDMAASLNGLGFAVFINIMQAHDLEDGFFANLPFAEMAAHLAGVYLADSFGAMKPDAAAHAVDRLVGTVKIPVGVHFHDNLGLAMANSMAAYNRGASLIDGTVLGIGRGAGNTRLESLVLEYFSADAIDTTARLMAIWKDWISQRGGNQSWGPSFEYSLAAKFSVHPTYVQEMGESGELNTAEQAITIKTLGVNNASKFSPALLDVGNRWFDETADSGAPAWTGLEGRNVLLVGSGTSVSLYRNEIDLLLGSADFSVILVGGRDPAGFDCDFRIISHPMSVLSQPGVLDSEIPCIGPLNQIRTQLKLPDRTGVGHSIDLVLSSERFGLFDSKVYASSSRSSLYALALLAGSAPAAITLAGFDGYPAGDSRNHEFNSAIQILKDRDIGVASITPSQFDVPFRAS
ncbi:hypothetical protein N8716_00050 [Pontimonas sp.]|nr:hypothetical protein [Pontimonas sp.]